MECKLIIDIQLQGNQTLHSTDLFMPRFIHDARNTIIIYRYNNPW